MLASEIAGVSVRFPSQPCAFTFAELERGVSLRYEIVVDSAVQIVQDPPNCGVAEASGIYLQKVITGGGTYCVCDRGLCAPEPAVTISLAAGAHGGTFDWNGHNWQGPSDTNNPVGARFNAGTSHFEVTLAARTEDGGPPRTVRGSFPIRISE